MARRAMATGNISFGMVSIPVKVYNAVDSSKAISFNQLHKGCGKRLKQQLTCPEHGVVSSDHVAKGYEHKKGEYVVFGKEELKALEPRSTKQMEIAEFVPLADLARFPLYHDKSYFVGPDKGGDKPYKLLAKALESKQAAAIARYAIRGKEYLVAIRPYGGGLVMDQLHYAENFFSFDMEVDAEVSDGELDLATKLIEQAFSETFDPTRYQDTHRQRVVELVEKKVEGGDISDVPVSDSNAGTVVDLMSALKASLESETKVKSAKQTAKKVAKKARSRHGVGGVGSKKKGAA